MPTTTAPAARSRATTGWSAVAVRSGQAGEPSVARLAGDVDVVLDRHRHPGERQRGPVGSRVDGRRLGERGLGADDPERPDPRVDGLEVGQVRAHDVDRAQRAGTHPLGDLHGGQTDDVTDAMSSVETSASVHPWTVTVTSDRHRSEPSMK